MSETLVLQSDNARLSIALVERLDADEPNADDVMLAMSVSSSDHAGSEEGWIEGSKFAAFAVGLRDLEHSRQGEAVLQGHVPDDIELGVRAIDPKGPMAVEGHLGDHHILDQVPYWHSVWFGFEFEPWQLGEACKVPTHAIKVSE